MKRLLWIALCTCMTLAALAQKQQGIVRTIERPGQKSVGINGVTIKINEYPNAIVSGKGGKFSFTIQGKRQGDRCLVTRVEKKGYTLIDKMPSFAYSISTPVEIVMVSNKQLQQDEKRIRDKATEKAEANYNKRIAELERQLQEKTISEEKYREQLQHVFDGYENYIKMIDDMARRYAMTDYKGISDINRQIQECIENAELERADSLINSKGDINRRKKELEDKRDIKQKIDSLQLVLEKEIDFSTNELANDFYSKHLICASRYNNDSAAYYLEERANLDTTNMKWQNEAGNYIRDYTTDYNKSLFYFNRLLRLSVLKGISYRIAQAYNNIGQVFFIEGDFERAIEYTKKALDISNKDSYNKNNDNVIFLNNLAECYRQIGDFEKSISYLEEAIRIHEGMQDSISSDLAETYNNLGGAYLSLSNFKESLAYFEKAYMIRKILYKEKSTQIANSYSNLAIVMLQLNNSAEALDNAKRALSIQKSIYGDNHPIVAISYNNIGNILVATTNYNEALNYYLMSKEIKQSVFGVHHQSVGMSYNNIGDVLNRMGEYNDAIVNLKDALTIWKNTFGESHPNISMVYNNLGSVYNNMGEYTTALLYLRLALQISKEVYGEDSADAMYKYNNIGFSYYSLGDITSALEYYQHAYEICIKYYSDDSPLAQKILDNIAKAKAATRQKNDN